MRLRWVAGGSTNSAEKARTGVTGELGSALVAAAKPKARRSQRPSWKLMDDSHLYERPQPAKRHTYGRSPVCRRSWIRRLERLVKALEHMAHGCAAGRLATPRFEVDMMLVIAVVSGTGAL